MASSKRLFVSHASYDSEIVAEFVRLLESGVGVPSGSIFCSSAAGQGVRPGDDFVSSIRRHVTESSVTLAFLTPTFRDRPFCWGELGAAWAISAELIPMVTPLTSWDELEATILKGKQGVDLGRSTGLDDLRDVLVETLSLSAMPTAKWTREKGHFEHALASWADIECQKMKKRVERLLNLE